MRKKVVYIEPADYILEKLRKEYHLGEYADENNDIEIALTVETKNCTLKAEGISMVEKLIEVLYKDNKTK